MISALVMVIKSYYVYILTNVYHTVLYTGVTNDLERRVFEHKHKIFKGFTSRYNVSKLVYYEIYDRIDTAIAREKQLKRYTRSRKEELIIEFNYNWKDLYQNGKIVKSDNQALKSDNY